MARTENRRRARSALRAAEAGAGVAEETFRGTLEVEEKTGAVDLVTQADRAAQSTVVESIRSTYPDEPIVAEEDDAPQRVPDEGPAWIVDPIDGTNNYVRGMQVYNTAVASVIDAEAVGAAVILPSLGDVYRGGPDGAYLNDRPLAVSQREDPAGCTVSPTMWGAEDRRDAHSEACRVLVEGFGDVRRFGSGQATLVLVAAGALDGAVATGRPSPWDTVAGVSLIRQAGGVVTDLVGEPWRHDSDGLVASNGAIHGELLEAVAQIER